MSVVLIVLSALLLAYANGANDNFKGVATLFGSGTTNYRRALAWATVTTFVGSIVAVLLAGQLLKSFSGRGLVADSLVSNVDFVTAVALAAGLTVLLATRIGMPISTTHSLVGALVGAGWASGSALNVSKLVGDFLSPLAVSPLLAIVVTSVAYPLFRFARHSVGVTRQTCFCMGTKVLETVPVLDSAAAMQRVELLTAQFGDVVTCREEYAGRFIGLEAAPVLDRLHYLSAGVVSFARGLNDTPKIAAMLLIIPALPGMAGVAVVGTAIAIGGLLSARRVADVMSRRITSMNHGQGFTANLVTGIIVIGASRLGLPVSTTHVSCGALFGIGTVNGTARWRMIGTILLAWVTTLPVAAALAAAAVWTLTVI